MKLALSTLGCPDWDLDRICAAGAEAGFDGVDLRGYLDEVDVTQHPRFTDQIEETRVRLDEAGLAVNALGSGISVCEVDAREANLAEARRIVEAGEALDVDRIRVFGGGEPDATSRDELARVGGETMREILAIDGADEFQWLLETHDAWTATPEWRRLLDQFPTENTGVIWDAAHTIRLADESPGETLDALGDRLAHVHLKDATYDPDHHDATHDGYVYAVPGEGDLPIADVVRELRARGYDDWVVFEHEKRWHPSLTDPADAFPAFVDWFESVE